MLFLISSIAAMSAFMLALKFFAAKNIKSSQAITINYALATIIGIFSSNGDISTDRLFDNGWWYLAVVAGALLFGSMHLMAVSTKLSGVAVTTISARTSLIVPIIFSAIFFGETITVWQGVGAGLVVVSFILIFHNGRHRNRANRTNGRIEAARRSSTDSSALKTVLMPVGVFMSVGVIAVCMKSAQQIIGHGGNYAADYPMYQTMNFGVATICAIIYYAITEGRRAFAFSWKSILGGASLGVFNYITVSSVLLALRTLPTSTFYAVYNTGVVIVTATIGWLVFGEKLPLRKIAGIILAIAAIAVVMLTD